MVISQDKIEEIRTANDIVDVISSYIQLTKKGKNYLARCPFHNEKTPSFNVSPDKQMFYCFGCHTGGNVFTFVQKYEKLSFIDAVKKLADKVNISITSDVESDQKEKERESLLYINQVVAEYYHDLLLNSASGKIGLDYLLNRGISEETIDKFILGFSINSWEGLVKYAEERNLNFANLEKIGLVNKRTDNSYYDYFRGRVMFPIFGINSKISGFGARKLFEDDNSGKYINSKESIIYNKSRILYGLFQAKEEIRKNESAILVEGYMDFLTLFQSGFRNIIATSGTALTADQLKILSRYTKNILFLYDSDMAGVNATIRGLDLILEQGFNVKIVELAEGEDPDSYLRKFGNEKLKKAIDGSVSFIEFIAKVYKKLGKLGSTKDSTDSIRGIITLISKVKDDLKRQFYIKEIADKFDLYETAVRNEFDRIISSNIYKRNITSSAREKQEVVKETAPTRIKEEKKIYQPPAIEEEDLIALIIMEGKAIIDFVFQYINIDEIQNQTVKELINFLNERFTHGEVLTVDEIIDQVNDENIKGLIVNLIFTKKIVPNEELVTKYKSQLDIEKWAKDLIKKFKIKKTISELNEIGNKIRHAETQNINPEELLAEYQRLISEKKEWEEAQ